jgi:hypothetical protein
LEWTDVVPVLETIDSLEELRAAADNPEALLERVSRASGSAAKKLAIMHLKPLLDPCLHARGLEWADVVPVLETIDSIDELHAAAADPKVLLEQIFALKQTKTAEDFTPPEQELNSGGVDLSLSEIQLNLSSVEQRAEELERQVTFEAEELERQGRDLDQPCGAEVQFATEAQPVSMNQLTACLEWAPGCVDLDRNPTHPTKVHSPARPVDRRANMLSEPVEPLLPAHSLREVQFISQYNNPTTYDNSPMEAYPSAETEQ